MNELMRDISVPSNCPGMKSPRLNDDIWMRIPENAFSKDKAVYDRQVATTKAVVHLLQTIDKNNEAMKLMRKNGRRDKSKFPLTPSKNEAYRQMSEVD